MKPEKARLVSFFILVCGVIILFTPGCGKKGPPMPPLIDGQKISIPFNLKYKLADNTVRLSWKHEIDAQKAVVKPEGFDIFMARKTFEACEGCPFKFNKVGFVSMPDMAFTIKLEQGYKYYFRVQATGEETMKSDVSKIVQVEYK